MARALRVSFVAAALLASATAATSNDTIALTLDRATVIRAPEKTSMVVVGNPSIADVTVQKNGVMVLTGKNFGETNLLALDDEGKLISESWLRVEAMSRNRVTVYRGADSETYACSPNCQPTVALGDSEKYFGKASGQVGTRNALSAGTSTNPSR
jgi:Pilus formation protein N terminal region